MDEKASLVEILFSLIMAMWILEALFFFCEFGERVSTQFDLFGEELQRCDWYTLPIEIQKIFLLFSLDTLQEKNIKCYFNILSNRRTFKKVFKFNYTRDIFSNFSNIR